MFYLLKGDSNQKTCHFPEAQVPVSGTSLRYPAGLNLDYPRFPSNPSIIRVPFFLLFSFKKETPQKGGKRVLLGYKISKHLWYSGL